MIQSRGKLPAISRYANGSLAFGDIFFSGAESIVKQGSDKFLRVPDVVSFPHVMHNGKVSLVPVIIDVRKDPGLSMEPDQ